MTNKRSRKPQHRPHPKPQQRRPDGPTIDGTARPADRQPGIGHNSGNVPAKLIAENRTQSNQIITALANAVKALTGANDNPLVHVELMERLWKMQREAQAVQAENEYGIAKVALAMELPTIPKRHKIEFVDKHNQKQEREYADRVDIESVLDPLCRKHGFSKEYSTRTDAKGWAAQLLTVRHVGGHKEVYESPYMPLDTSGAKNNQQGAGSSAEYGKRYAVVGAFNVLGVDWDDDGSGGKDTAAPNGDKFSQRVQQDAEKPEPPKAAEKPPKLTLPEAADALEAKIRKAPQVERGKILMGHINIIGAMEKDTNLSVKAVELRKLCEEVADAA